MKFPPVALGELVAISTGNLDSNAAVVDGAYPFFTCARETYRTDTCAFDCEAVILAGNNANGVYPIKYFQGQFDAYQRTYILRSVDERRLLNRYLFYALSLQLSRLQVLSTGAATKFLTLGILRPLPIPLPSLAIQSGIVDILSAYDDLIENNTKRIKILEEMARSLYREWFVYFRFPGHEKVKKVPSPLGKIPQGWRLSELGALVDDIRDSVDPSGLDPDTPYFGLEHLPRRSIALGEWGRAADVQSTKLRVSPMDILFGKIRPYFHKVGPSPVEGVSSSDAIVLRVRSEDAFGLVIAITSSDEFVARATQTSQGTKMPRASWDVLRGYPVALPPAPLLREFNDAVTTSVKLIHTLLFKNRNLQATRDLLLPRLLSGQVTIPP